MSPIQRYAATGLLAISIGDTASQSQWHCFDIIVLNHSTTKLMTLSTVASILQECPQGAPTSPYFK